MNSYQEYIAKSRYARYLEDEKRRETWPETVDRYINFFKNRGNIAPWDELRNAIVNLDIMPSMRCMMTAGEALDRDNVAGYNCSYAPIDHIRVFDEIMYILMCGTGVGFSVERQYINKLPEVSETLCHSIEPIVVADSKIGWATALKEYFAAVFKDGEIRKFDVSKVRPAGARLKTFGGRASGPKPLLDLQANLTAIMLGAQGRKLNSIECHDIVCHIASVVICGGVRRSALISLSNLTDQRMRQAKTGEWYSIEPQRSISNNSVCYTEKPDIGIFMEEWLSLYRSKSGERGLFNREAARAAIPARRSMDHEFGTNPCSEIILRPFQFCNLSEVVVRPDDDEISLKYKITLATILGTLQSTLVDFKYLRPIWRRNTEEERLLGVSLTGMMDHHLLSTTGEDVCHLLERLKAHAQDVNKVYADLYNIPVSSAITCVKPSGTVSQLVDSASGIHPRHAPYYIRRVRGDDKDPITHAMIEQGVPHEEDVTSANQVVFSFPMKAPPGSVMRWQRTAIEQLEHWNMVARHWCEHKPSVTIYVREHEWLEVGSWVYSHWEDMSGVSFLPYTDHVYRQAPYEDITEGEYEIMLEGMPPFLDFDGIVEDEDVTTASQEFACVAGQCEI